MSRTARATAIGAAWNYGAQIATVVVQLAYAALTSRLLGPEAFGRYGIALTVAALVTLLATAGLPQAVSRMQTLDPGRLGGLLWYAAGIGAIAAVFLLVTADGWAAVWGAPGVGELLRVLAVAALFTPAMALGTGVLLRSGRFRALAITTLACNVGGMAVGLLAVDTYRTAVMLVVSPVVALVATALASICLSRRLFAGRPRADAVLADIGYSGRITVSSILSYGAGNVGKFALSHGFGPALLGHWNRAEVLTNIPLTQVQNALTQALSPEFRHDIASSERARRTWADVLGLVAWICLPVAAVLAAVVPVLVPAVLGPGWALVGTIAPYLAVFGGVQATAFVLVTALEVLARFRWVWAGHVLVMAIYGVGGIAALVIGSFVPVLVAGIAALVAMHGLHVWLCHRAGLLRAGVLVGHYVRVVLASVVLAAVAYVVVRLPEVTGGRTPVAVGLVLVLAACAVAGWRVRERLPAVALARKYGVLGRSPALEPAPSGRAAGD